MTTATMSAKQVELAKEVNAAIEAHAVRKAGYLEQVRKLFSDVNGEGRTLQGVELGKVISDSLAEEKSIPNKKKWVSELAKQVCGSYSDDRKLINYVKLFHISLRVPTLKQLGLTWAIKCVSAMKTGFDWKAVCDDMPHAHIERAQFILPQLHDGIDGLGCDEKGNPQRALWTKIIGYYIEHGELPVDEVKPEAETEANEVETETSVTSFESVVAWMKNAAPEALVELMKSIGQDQREALVDAIAEVPVETK